ncbi:MAG: SusC/RagA family protein, partial [Bacteroidales bacterium]|nr:SusC/RagA family protein [Bacteroidales bacterium]
FTWGVDANLSDVINTITDMKGTYNGSGAIRNQEGSSINSLYGLKCLGMIKTQEQADWMNTNCPQYNIESKPGDLVYKDINEDGKIDDNDRMIIGCCLPRYTYGLTLSLGWKGLNLSAQFQGVGKADAYLSSYYTQPCQQGGTFRKEHLDRWTPATPDGKFPRMSYGTDNTLNSKTSTFWMGNAAYCRLKNLQLSYSLPKKVIKKAGMSGLMFFANATNLFTITNYYQGYDPENQYSGGTDGATTGAFASNYPLVKNYTFGVEIKF